MSFAERTLSPSVNPSGQSKLRYRMHCVSIVNAIWLKYFFVLLTKPGRWRLGVNRRVAPSPCSC